jgi:hypothetical protein
MDKYSHSLTFHSFFYTFFFSFTVLTLSFSPDCWMEIGLQSILKWHFDSYFDIRFCVHTWFVSKVKTRWKIVWLNLYMCSQYLARLCQSLSWAFLIESVWRLSACKLFTIPTSSEPLHSQSPNLTQMFLRIHTDYSLIPRCDNPW